MDDLKILKAIRQSKKRKQKKKDSSKDKKSDDAGFEQAIEGSDSEADEEAGAEEMVMGKKETADGTWIMEVLPPAQHHAFQTLICCCVMSGRR